MRTRKIGKFEFVEIQNPDGGYSYYAKAGPEGMMLAANMGDFPAEIYVQLAAWNFEERKYSKPLDPAPEFNRKGWAF